MITIEFAIFLKGKYFARVEILLPFLMPFFNNRIILEGSTKDLRHPGHEE